MEIKITKNFVIQVPKFTDDLKDLQKLYQMNFGMFKFNNDDYELLNQKIVLSKNTNWNKAIALVILNEKLIAKAIFTKRPQEDYPYYHYPMYGFRKQITSIVETLAVRSMTSLVNNVKQLHGYQVATYILNAMTFSLNLIKNDTPNLKKVFSKNAINKHQPSLTWIDELDPDDLTKAIDQQINYESSPLSKEIFADFQDELDDVLNILSDRQENIIRLRYQMLGEKDSYLTYSENWTYQRIADLFGVNIEKIKQIQKAAIKKLRAAEKNDQLKQFLEETYASEELHDPHNQLLLTC
ncbi:sigma-70 family RNA polymerase sigma factor [Lactobacillus xujianguonis]|uniref:sigma-70 family RNA polymerase sigma factor n=1 Tax=Lactobacillus xujianguonis TaxID=2495899 RepID=UPI000FD7D0D4|nr:sigma-70 family RNA polymerase sigma factor [Lactobacillus xujianguonis]RVU73128.1 sigma-70 family RNA polymerase sigma factor [Lactobacillus xujianguonis]